MKKLPKKQITYWFSVIVVGVALGLGLQFVRAWTEPSTTPPGGNLGAPINTGAQNQTKSGGITAGTLTAPTVTGTTQLCIGTDCRTSWPSGGGGGGPASCQCDGYSCGSFVCGMWTCDNCVYPGVWQYGGPN